MWRVRYLGFGGAICRDFCDLNEARAWLRDIGMERHASVRPISPDVSRLTNPANTGRVRANAKENA